jgi:hypothetical protein
MYCNFEGNRFISTKPIEFTKIDQINGVYQDDVYEIVVNWTIMNNFFAGNTEGLRARYWHHRTGSNYNKTFIADSADNVVKYSGNTGDCPADSMKGFTASAQNVNDNYIQLAHYGSWDVKILKRYSKRVMTFFNTRYKSIGNLKILDADSFPGGLCTNYVCEHEGTWGRHNLAYLGTTNMCFGYWAATDPINNGDLFAISQCGPTDSTRIKYLTIHDYNTEHLLVL